MVMVMGSVDVGVCTCLHLSKNVGLTVVPGVPVEQQQRLV